MALNNCTINFDNHPEPVFYAGETVSGTVFLTLNKDKKCKALMITVIGMSKCNWGEREGTGESQRTVHYTGKQVYMETYNNLIADQLMSSGVSNLSMGKHAFRFTLFLPANLPSSLEETYGNTIYTVEITLKRSFKFDLSHSMIITVLSTTDLNLIPNLNLPIVNETSEKFYSLLIFKGTVNVAVQIPLSGFIPGQSVLVKCVLKNDTNIRVKRIEFQLRKKKTFTCTYPRTDKKVIFDKYPLGALTNIPEISEYSEEITVIIPPVPVSTLGLSSIIDVSYELEAITVTHGFHSNISSTIPVVIGTIPIYSQASFQPAPGTSSLEPTAPTLDPSCLLSSAPFLDYTVPSAPLADDLPPPSYEEAMRHESDKTMEDDEDEYPVYDYKMKNGE